MAKMIFDERGSLEEPCLTCDKAYIEDIWWCCDEKECQYGTESKEEIMELKDTVTLMTTADWKERFRAEYLQLKIRTRELKRMLDNWDNLDFTPNCPKGLLVDQYNAMDKYFAILKDRAAIEGIEVEE